MVRQPEKHIPEKKNGVRVQFILLNYYNSAEMFMNRL